MHDDAPTASELAADQETPEEKEWASYTASSHKASTPCPGCDSENFAVMQMSCGDIVRRCPDCGYSEDASQCRRLADSFGR